MDFTEIITPKRVATILGGGFLISVALILAKPHTGLISSGLDVWRFFIDLVSILSLLITLVVLFGLKRIERKYLFRATAPSLLSRLKEKTNQLADSLRDPDTDGLVVGQTLMAADAVLKEIVEVVQDEEVKSNVGELRASIKQYQKAHTPEKDAYDILSDLRRVEEYMVGLIERSKWRR